MFLYSGIIVDVVRLLMRFTNASGTMPIIEVFRNALYLALFIGYLKNSGMRVRIEAILYTAIFELMCIITLLINDRFKAILIEVVFLFMSRSLIALLITRHIKDTNIVIEYIHGCAWIIIPYILVYSVSPHDTSTGFAYNMSLSYYLLLPSLVCIYQLLCNGKRKLYSLSIIIVSVVAMFLYGSRGPILCLTVSVIFMIFIPANRMKMVRLTVGLLVMIAVLCLSLFKEPIIAGLSDLFPKSRFIYMIKNDMLVTDSGRDFYYLSALSALKSEPFAFRGISGDGMYYASLINANVTIGQHSHNFFIEQIMSFGIMIGGIINLILCTSFLVHIYRALKYGKMLGLCILFIIPFFVFVNISGSLWSGMQGWMLIGALSNHEKQARLVIGDSAKYSERMFWRK